MAHNYLIRINFFLLSITMLAGCARKDEKLPEGIMTGNTWLFSGRLRSDFFLKEKQFQMQQRKNYSDSLRREEISQTIFNDVPQTQSKKINRQRKQYYSTDRVLMQFVNIRYGPVFSNACTHLILERHDSGSFDSSIEIYIQQNDSFRFLFSETWGDVNFPGYTIQDVNGDQYADLVINWQPSAGCCPRDVRDVYIYKEQTGEFGLPLEFMNPLFLPEKKMVRGMGYGHPHEVELYSYKWVEDTIELIEYIYPHPDESQRGAFVKSNYLLHENDSMDWVILDKVPAVYKQVEASDWMIAD